MARTWYDDDGSVPREEWGAPPQTLWEDRVDSETYKQRISKNAEEIEKIQKGIDKAMKPYFLRKQIEHEIEHEAIESRRKEREEAIKRAEEKRRLEIQKEREMVKIQIEHQNAVKQARDRYNSKSSLYRMFHRKLTVSRAKEMSTEEINKLYGGDKLGKGK